MAYLIETIRQLPVFRNVSSRALEEFSRLCIERKFGKTQMIYSRGGEEGKTYLILSGEVEIYSSAEGRKAIIQVLKPGDFFGDLAFTGHASMLPAQNAAQTTQETAVCVVNPMDINLLLKKYPEFAMVLLVTLRDQLHNAESKIKDLSISPAEIRLINELIRFAVRHGKKTQGFYEIEDKLTHQTLSEMIGVTRETVTKTLQMLKDSGFVEYTPDRLIRLNREKILNDCIHCLKMKEMAM